MSNDQNDDADNRARSQTDTALTRLKFSDHTKQSAEIDQNLSYKYI
jgi:hypothetical protein